MIVSRSARQFVRALCAATPALYLSLLVGSSALADEEKKIAGVVFRAAEKAFAQKNYREAAVGFDAAFEQAPHAAALFNAGLAWRLAKEPERAADRFSLALTRPELSSSQRDESTKHLRTLRQRLGWVSLSGPAGATATLLQAEDIALPITMHSPPGELRVQFKLGDYEESKRVTVSANEESTLVFEAPKVAEVEAPKTMVRVHGPTYAVGFVLTGVAGALGTVAIGTGVVALNARDTFVASGLTDVEAHEQADSLRTATNVAWISAAILAGAGVTLILTAPVSEEPAPAQGTGGTIGVTFRPGWVGLEARY